MKINQGNKMKHGILGLMIVAFIITSVVIVAADTPSADYCCEKTTYGAWCQNTKLSNCAEGFRNTPTSCDATSFCKQGCCYDSQEGICMENTPQRVCEAKNGTWGDSASCEIPQCGLGCCVLDNQAAFVTLVRCKKLSGFYGLTTDFRKNIKDEMSCIAVTQQSDQGACVYEQDFSKTCKFTTRAECLKVKSTGNLTQPVFYKDYLCSAEELAANCGPSEKTTCVPGKDEVYFLDTCGNTANIYDASKLNDKSYWKKIVPKNSSCGTGTNNMNSAGCGNCDYYLGSYCRAYDKTKDKTRPSYGDSICRDLNCYKTSDGKDHKHGESWCSNDGPASGYGLDEVGSRYFRHICVQGEELIEPCSDFRNEVCLQDSIKTAQGTFSQAQCRPNLWKSCTSQKLQKDCLNTDQRDCFWMDGIDFLTGQNGSAASSGGYQTNNFASNSSTSTVTGNVVATGDSISSLLGGSDSSSSATNTGSGGGVCLPNYPPGFDFWADGGGQATGICTIGNAQCEVTFEKGLLSSKKCVTNCDCLTSSWVADRNRLCAGLGDCGAYVNWLGKFTEDGIQWSGGANGTSIGQGLMDVFKKNTEKKDTST